MCFAYQPFQTWFNPDIIKHKLAQYNYYAPSTFTSSIVKQFVSILTFTHFDVFVDIIH